MVPNDLAIAIAGGIVTIKGTATTIEHKANKKFHHPIKITYTTIIIDEYVFHIGFCFTSCLLLLTIEVVKGNKQNFEYCNKPKPIGAVITNATRIKPKMKFARANSTPPQKN